LVGNGGPVEAMSDLTQCYVFGFCTLVDEIRRSVLFLLMELEVLVLRFEPSFACWMAAGMPRVLVGRFLAVAIPVLALHARQEFVQGTIPVQTSRPVAARGSRKAASAGNNAP